MRTIDLEGGPIQFTGALDWDRTEHGISPRRLPAWTRSQLPDDVTDWFVKMPSGVRLEFATDTRTIELTVLTTRFEISGLSWPPMTFDLVVDDTYIESQVSEAGSTFKLDLMNLENIELIEGAETTLRFTGLPDTEKGCQIWLPTNGFVELRSLRLDDAATIAAPAEQTRRCWVHHGSSISHCVEAESPTRTWPVVAAQLAGVEILNLGLAGNCQLDPFVARTIRDASVDLISLKVGINIANADSLRERTFGPALHGFLDTIRDGHPKAPILVASPIICPLHEDVPGPSVPVQEGESVKFAAISGHEEVRGGSLTLVRMREIIQDIIKGRRQRGDANLHYLDGLELFGPEEIDDLPDSVHPNAAGYVRMGERFYEKVFTGNGPFTL